MLNMLKKLRSYLGFKEREVLIQSFAYSNFSYYPLFWYFSTAKSLQKVEKLQEQAIRFIYNDKCSLYDNLLVKSKICSIELSPQRALSRVLESSSPIRFWIRFWTLLRQAILVFATPTPGYGGNTSW